MLMVELLSEMRGSFVIPLVMSFFMKELARDNLNISECGRILPSLSQSFKLVGKKI